MYSVYSILAAFAALGAAQAQDSSFRLAMTGIVLDQTDAGVAGAKITLQRNDGGVPVPAVADATGSFRFEGLRSGSYRLSVEHDGFKRTVSQVRIGARPPAPLVIRLQVADLRSSVTVTDRAAQLSTNSADNLDTVTLDRNALDNLPIFDQDYVGTMSRFLDAGSVATGGVTLIVDGIEATRAGVSASAIQEVKINQDKQSAR